MRERQLTLDLQQATRAGVLLLRTPIAPDTCL